MSVVVAAWNGRDALRACLHSLAPVADGGGQVIVARNFHVDVLVEFPWVEDVPCPAATTVPALRAAGLARARGDIVAFLEDHARVSAAWAGAIRAGHEAGHTAVGGPVAQGDARTALDWAAFFADYGAYAPPCRRGLVGSLSGLNMSVRRIVAERYVDLAEGVYESRLQRDLVRAGHRLWLEPDAIAIHQKRYSARETIRHAFHLAQGYAGRRLPPGSRARRVLFAVGAGALPVVLTARRGAEVVKRRRHWGPFVRALPWLIVLSSSWAAGEALGYLAGPGESHSKWL